MSSRVVYLDSSAIVKRYIYEKGSEEVEDLYRRALNGDLRISFSVWNIREVLGAFGKYLKKGYIQEGDYKLARDLFIGETLRLTKLKILKLVPVRTRLIMASLPMIEKHQIYIADAIQIASAKAIGADEFYTGDRRLCEVALSEGLSKTVYLGA